MQPALKSADNRLTISATCDGELANWEIRLATSIKNGAPGGCPISNLYPHAMNSGQSHKLAVGSTVRPYTTAAMANESHAMRVLSFEKVVCCMMLC